MSKVLNCEIKELTSFVNVIDVSKDSFLSNCFNSPIYIDSVLYLTVIHYYQAQKTGRIKDINRIIGAKSAYEALLIGRSVELRKDWRDIRFSVMKKALLVKFETHSDLAKKLKSTYAKEIVYFNTSHDNYWGYCKCKNCKNIEKLNNLGKILMQVRSYLIQKDIDKEREELARVHFSRYVLV